MFVRTLLIHLPYTLRVRYVYPSVCLLAWAEPVTPWLTEARIAASECGLQARARLNFSGPAGLFAAVCNRDWPPDRESLPHPPRSLPPVSPPAARPRIPPVLSLRLSLHPPSPPP